MSAALSQQAREAIRVLELLIASQELTVPTAARLLKKSPRWVRENLPVVVHSHKSHHVRLVDVEAYQKKRTLWPQLGRDNGK